ncbi:MAG: hypothetical protein Q8M94_00005, partial [Ignavibacteria bacterium]|nr:hypothetical protein [Ignavibacteria bacterium]
YKTAESFPVKVSGRRLDGIFKLKSFRTSPFELISLFDELFIWKDNKIKFPLSDIDMLLIASILAESLNNSLAESGKMTINIDATKMKIFIKYL